MGQTATFLVLTAAAAVAVLAWASFNRSVETALRVARAFYFVSVMLSIAALLWIMAGMMGMPKGAGYLIVLKLLLFRGWVVVGVGVSAALLAVFCFATRRCQGSQRAFATSPMVLKGLCFSVSISFLCVEIGKLSHDAEMRQFFLQSGYTVGFMYVVMGMEIAGAVGLLVPRSMVPAALGLVVIMTGAIRTHAHNGDPFSDSLEAVHLLILLACIVVLRLLPRMGHNKANRLASFPAG